MQQGLLKKIKFKKFNLFKRQTGVSLPENIILIAVISFVVITVFLEFGQQFKEQVFIITTQLKQVASP